MMPDVSDESQFVEYDGRSLRFTRGEDGGAEVLEWDGSEWEAADIGAGGTEAVVSADGRYAVLFHYSGQSEQGYEVFRLGPTPAHLGGFPESRGEGDAPAFSPDGRWLVMFMKNSSDIVRGTAEDFEEVADEDDSTSVVIDWATLIVHRLPENDVRRIAVGVEIPLSTHPDELSEWETYEAVRFDTVDEVVLAMPWGEELHVPLPSMDAVTSHGYTAD